MATQRIAFTEWTPDLAGVAENLSVAKNVVPTALGYNPFPTAVDYSAAASENLNNVFAGKFSATTNIFAGGATKLFKLDGADLSMDNVSKSVARTINNVALTSNVATITTSSDHGYSTGDTVTVDASNNTFDGTYTITSTPTTTTFTYAKVNANIASASATGTVIAGAYASVVKWNFTQFGNAIICANNINKVQSFTLGSSSSFGDLSPDAPVAKYVTVVRDFVVCANLDAGSNSNKIQWSNINDETNWTPGAASQSDFQIIADGGNITGMTGGEVGLIFLDRAVVRMSYIGSPLFFQFDTISRNIGCVEGNSVVQYGGTSYFLGADGFYSCDGSTITAIGTQKVDAWFYANVNQSLISSMSSTIDPFRKIVVWKFIDNFAQNTLLIYNWQVQKWSYGTTDVDYVSSSASTGQTLEGLSSAYVVAAGSFTIGKSYTIETLGDTTFTSIGALDNVVGARFTATGVGTGTGTAVDLEAAAAASRTLDTLTTSLDDGLWAGGKFLFAGARDTKVVTFTGANAAAQITTGDIGSESTSVVTLARPVVDNGSGSVAIASRMLLNATPQLGSYTAADSENRVSLRSSGKYHRISVIPTGDRWSNAIGVDIDVTPQGSR
jgi:hypothetical protein